MGADAAAERAAATRDAEVTLGLETAVRAPPPTMEGRLVGTGRRPALAADGVCGLADAADKVTEEGVGLVTVLETPAVAVGVLIAPGVAVVAALALTVRVGAAGVLGEPVLLERELAAAERAAPDATESRPVTVGFTGDLSPVADLTGEAVRDVMLADVGGLDADAEETLLPTLVALVLLAVDGGALRAKLVLGAGVLAGVAATVLVGLRREAAVLTVAGRVALAAGVA